MASHTQSSSGRPGAQGAADAPDACCGCAGEGDGFSARVWLRLAVAAVFAGQGMVLSLAVNLTPPAFGGAVYWVLHGGLIAATMGVLVFLGGPLFRATFAMVRERRLSIEGLFTLSLLGAFAGSLVATFTGTGDVYYEVVAIVLAIHTVGRLVGQRSRARLREESARLRETFDTARVVEDGEAPVRMPLSELTEGSVVRVAPGEPFTVDGTVVAGTGFVSETALTGEPTPVVRHEGDRVRAGTWSVDGRFDVRAAALEGDRELDGILRTVEDAGGRPSELQTQADALMRGFLPFVVGVSAATAIYWSFAAGWVEAVLNSMAVLLVACPCALGLATPVAVWQGLYRLAGIGLVSRDGALLDALARTRRVFFDKTGTLSESALRWTEFLVLRGGAERRAPLLRALAAVEADLPHPVARALSHGPDAEAEADGVEGGVCRVEDLRVLPGRGVSARVSVDGVTFSLTAGEPEGGAADPVHAEALRAGLRDTVGKRVFVWVDGEPAAVAVLREQARSGTASTWEALEALGVRATVLTGDPAPALELPASVPVKAGLSAADKERAVIAAASAGEYPLVVGDGINDAAAMARASGAVAMGGGSAYTRATAAGQLAGDRIDAVPRAISVARKVHRTLRGNLLYAAAYNVLGMGFAAAGMLHPVFAAVLMLGSSFFVTARALHAAPGHNPG